MMFHEATKYLDFVHFWGHMYGYIVCSGYKYILGFDRVEESTQIEFICVTRLYILNFA